MLSHLIVSGRDLNMAKTHGAWFQDLMRLRFMMPHCKKFSERHSEVRGRFVWIQREAHSKSVGHHRG